MTTTQQVGWRNRIVREGEEAPEQLLANPKNWRVHPRAQQEALAGVLSEVGWVQRVIVNVRTQHVVDGHARIAMAISQGEPTVPVVYVDLSEQEEAKVLASFDPIGAMATADREQLESLLQEVRTDDAALRGMLQGLAEDNGVAWGQESTGGEAPEAEVDRAEELREKWQTRPGQLWSIGRHRLLCGDATKAEDVARLMGGETPDMVLTDPPYGIGLDTDYTQLHIGSRMVGHRVKRNRFDPVTGDDQPFDASLVKGTDGVGEQFWFGADYYAHTLGDTEHGGSWLVWDKRKPSQDDGFGSGFELIWSKERHKRVLLRHEWFGFLSGGDKEAQGRFHPTQKPSALYEDILTRWAKPGGVVYDPFCGSGSCLLAAERSARQCLALEIDPKYVAVTLERLAKMGLTPRLVA